MPAPHHSVFVTGRMPFLPPNQQCRSTEHSYGLTLLVGWQEGHPACNMWVYKPSIRQNFKWSLFNSNDNNSEADTKVQIRFVVLTQLGHSKEKKCWDDRNVGLMYWVKTRVTEHSRLQSADSTWGWLGHERRQSPCLYPLPSLRCPPSCSHAQTHAQRRLSEQFLNGTPADLQAVQSLSALAGPARDHWRPQRTSWLTHKHEQTPDKN